MPRARLFSREQPRHVLVGPRSDLEPALEMKSYILRQDLRTCSTVTIHFSSDGSLTAVSTLPGVSLRADDVWQGGGDLVWNVSAVLLSLDIISDGQLCQPDLLGQEPSSRGGVCHCSSATPPRQLTGNHRSLLPAVHTRVRYPEPSLVCWRV